MEITINDERRLYVLHSSAGVSCLGFENAVQETCALAEWLNKPELAPTEQEFGTLSVMEKRKRLLDLLARNKKDLGTWFNPKTPIPVCEVLDRIREQGEKVRLFYGNAETGLDWNEEQNVIGRIGRSMGLLKVPLLLDDEEGIGGTAILDHCLVRIIRIEDGKELYRHSSYHLRHIEAVPGDDSNYPVKVLADGSDYAFFKTEGEAYHWLAFIMGACHQAP
ncbi:MAG: hypothetical protein JAZ11_02900 [Candidatus Thiodiazotropha lotti]|nr:hypothetical protein [Candidatus Thiodiazotropha lotti]